MPVRDLTLIDLLGGEIAPEGEVMAGIGALQTLLVEQSRQAQERSSEQMSASLQVVEALFSERQQDTQVLEASRELAKVWDPPLEPPAIPEAPPEDTRIFSGSLGATVAPPYHYGWSWAQPIRGTMRSLTADALAQNGNGSASGQNGSNDAWGIAGSAVATFFRPITHQGILRIATNPIVRWNRQTISFFGYAYVEAHVSLVVFQFTNAGAFEFMPINDKRTQYDYWTWFLGSFPDEQTVTVPFSTFLWVDNAHYYVIAVAIECQASGVGAGEAWFGFATSGISMLVPSITWELF
jgi:hypothetical protein